MVRHANDPEMRALFEREAGEELAAIQRLLPNINDAEAAAALWSHAHTLKGSAAVMDLEDVAGLARTLEDVFIETRAGQAALTDAEIDVLAAAIEDVRYIVSGQLSGLDVSGAVRDARSALSALADSVARAHRRGRVPPPDVEETRLVDIELRDWLRAIAGGQAAVLRFFAAATGIPVESMPEYERLREVLGDPVEASL